MIFRNLTPHPVSVVMCDGTTKIYPVSGIVPRLDVCRVPLGEITDKENQDGGGYAYDDAGMPWLCPEITIYRSTLAAPTGLPEKIQGTLLIVSALVAEHLSLRNRDDLVYPGEPIRDDQGRVVGCRGLCANPGLDRLMCTSTITH